MTECISNPEFGCACVDQDPVVCFYIRYHKNPLELTKEDICECECHANFDPLDEDEQDRDERLADYDMMKEMQKADHEIEMKCQRAEIEAIEREKDERQKYCDKSDGWKQEDGNSDD